LCSVCVSCFNCPDFLLYRKLVNGNEGTGICFAGRFVEVAVAPEVELLKPWRVRILQELKKRLPEEGSSFEKYEKAVEM
jgi:hypothetical protein